MIALGSDCSPSPTNTSGNVHLSGGERLEDRVTDPGQLVITQVREDRQREDFAGGGLTDRQGSSRKTQERSLLMTWNRVMDRALNPHRRELLMDPRAVRHPGDGQVVDPVPSRCVLHHA